MSWTKHRDEVIHYSLDFANELATGEALTGTPTVTVTLNGVDKTSEVVESGTPLVQGTAVVFTAKAGETGEQLEGTYVVKGAVATDATPARTLVHTETLTIARTGDAR